MTRDTQQPYRGAAVTEDDALLLIQQLVDTTIQDRKLRDTLRLPTGDVVDVLLRARLVKITVVRP